MHTDGKDETNIRKVRNRKVITSSLMIYLMEYPTVKEHYPTLLNKIDIQNT